MPYLLPQPLGTSWPPYAYFCNAFCVNECETILEFGKSRILKPATVGNNQEDRKQRRAKITWLEWSEEFDWVFDRLSEIVSHAHGYYPFHLSAITEPLQLTQYLGEDRGHYGWHRDIGEGPMSLRKLSMVVQLNPSSEFAGGEFEIFSVPGEIKTVTEIGQGTVIVFPSWEVHRVKPVTAGERWSLISWVSGPLFC